jgi:hypothetical protein
VTIGLLQGIVEVIGESDNDIGGLFSTRLTAVVAAGATSLPVESTLGWASSGRVGLEGQFYTYDSLTATTLDGIKRNNNGVVVPGTAQDHRDEGEVIDLTRIRSAIDLVRRALLADYAEGPDLNTIGRNLNVLRSPFLSDDDRFRKIIKALAYNPRGTMYGLELALDGLVDPGNYEIFEDLVNFPCTVFVRLLGAATTDDVSAGKAFVNDGVAAPATSDTTVVIPSTPLTVESVLWADELAETDTRSAKPSADTIVEYDGQAPQPVWTFDGASEVADVLVTAGQYTELTDSAVGTRTAYERTARIQPESNADITVLWNLPSTGTFGAAIRQAVVEIRDTARDLFAGVLDNSPTDYLVGLANDAGHLGTPVLLQKDTFYSIGVHKRGVGTVEMTVDGTVVDRVPYTSFSLSLDHKFIFGCRSTTAAGAKIRVKSVEIHATTLTDYWNSRGAAGDVSAATPQILDINIPGHVTVADIGKRCITRGSTVTNPQGGNNNGVWKVLGVPTGETLDLTGDPHPDNAAVNTANPTRITVSLPKAFRFPDDLGKKIQITGSGLGNNGTFVIDKLLDPDTLVDLQAALTQNPSRTNVCEVVGGAFVTELSLDWRLFPDFATEVGIDWELSATGSVAGTTLTLRQVLPLAAGVWRVLRVRYTDVLSGQIMQDSFVSNTLLSEGPPPLYDYYPFYVSDPLGFVRSYLDAITAAGVIPEFLIV